MMKKYGLAGKDNKKVKLNRLEVTGNICGEYTEYTISQDYKNTTGENIEGVYSFPIPTTSLITGIEVNLGGRNLKAVVESRDGVLTTLKESKEEGINTLTLEQKDDEYFTVTIGNILPNEKVNLKITYMDQLTYEDDTLTLYIPSVVDPVYYTEDDEEEETEDVDFYLSLLVESYSRMDFKSPSHKIKVEREDDTLSKVTVSKEQTLDHDFILRLRETKSQVAAGMAYSYFEDEEEKAILMLKLTPVLPDIPVEYTTNYSFILDTSVSMEGFKLEEAKNAVLIALRSLDEGDKFNLIAYNEEVYKFSAGGKVKFTKENLAAATEWVEGLTTREGDSTFDALKDAIREAEEDGEENTIFLFTDDNVENEDEVLEYVRSNVGINRIFPIGMDTEVNSYFINKLAEVGNGRPEFIDEGERIDDIILRQFNRIHNPQLDVTGINFGDMVVEKTYPGTITYLYDREPFTIFALVNGYIEGSIDIHGVVDDVDYTMHIDLDKLEIEENSKLIKKVWARKRIESLVEKERSARGVEAEQIKEEILRLSKENSIISSETSFIMMETIEDPVLGIGLHKIVPVDMDETTMKNLARGYFLDEAAYSFDANIREKMASTGLTHKEAKNAIRYDRDNLLRVLAKNQQADGSFLNLGEETPEEILETTLRALLAFLVGSETTSIYLNNVSKALRYIIRTLIEEEKLITERNYMLFRVAYDLAEKKNLMKERIRDVQKSLVSQVSDLKYKESLEEVGALVTSATPTQKKFITAGTLNISKSSVENAHEIFERDIKSNITNIANIALAKAL
ncbi:VWA domain-containing protein [Proteiniclasticum sp. BAD-10]|uniref:VWA domain-containing protein n=1 Tax=Proteiniclasticum sediminis TaxID=2804028 RepID=A0A941HR10_9CLOT|nr:VIT and VWA domain-containing protein [Proteiniclasticum sediminis]MBR0575727.1 VWA domain-containing protein [Proteiniclasticum sediminis]